jgi:hypothetical protein
MSLSRASHAHFPSETQNLTPFPYPLPPPSPETALPKAWAYIQSHPGILYLGLGQSCFEGAMYAFVFVWTPALQVPIQLSGCSDYAAVTHADVT